MKKISLKIKAIVFLLAALTIVVFTGCGADVATKLDVDKDFKGTRTIEAVISNSELKDYVKGGADGIEEIIKKNIPSEMKYTRSGTDSGVKFTFTVEFSNFDEYKTKMNSILKQSGYTKDSGIEYEYTDNPFKTKVSYKENFGSAVLLDWLTNAVAEAKIVSKDKSNFVDSSKASLTIAGKKYSVSSTIKASEKDITSFDTIRTDVYLNDDGTIKKDFTFVLSDTNKEKLSQKGTNIEDYFNGILPEKAAIDSSSAKEKTTYVISITTSDTAEIIEATKKIMCCENVAFSKSCAPGMKAKGIADITIKETVDAIYYLNDSYDFKSYIHPYAGSEPDFDSTGFYPDMEYDDDYKPIAFGYNPSGEDVTFYFKWKVLFDLSDVEITADKKYLTEKLSLTIPSSLPEELSAIVSAGITESIPSQDKVKLTTKTDDENTTYTILFKRDEIKAVCDRVSAFISNYSGKEMSSNDIFAEETRKKLYSISYNLRIEQDLSALSGKDGITLTLKAPLFSSVELSNRLLSNERSSEKSNCVVADDGRLYVNATLKTIRVIPIIITVILVAAAMAALVLLIKSGKITLSTDTGTESQPDGDVLTVRGESYPDDDLL